MASAISSPRRLTVVVSTRPYSGDLERALHLARAARELGHEVAMFFMDRAVSGLPDVRGQLRDLAADGCELCACASSAYALGLGERDVGVLLGSQDDHAAMVHRAHRVVAFT